MHDSTFGTQTERDIQMCVVDKVILMQTLPVIPEQEMYDLRTKVVEATDSLVDGNRSRVFTKVKHGIMNNN